MCPDKSVTYVWTVQDLGKEISRIQGGEVKSGLA